MKTIVDKNKKKTINRALKYIGNYKIFLFFSLICALIYTSLTLYTPILIGSAIDYICGPNNVDFKEVFSYLTKAILLFGIAGLSNLLIGMINNLIAQHISRDIRNEAFSKIQKIPLSYIDTTPHGDIVNRVVNDTERFTEGLLLGFTEVITGVLTIVGTLVFMLIINWKIAIAVVFLTPISIFIAKFIGKRTYTMFKLRSETEAESASHIDEMLGNQKIVKAFGYEQNAMNKFDEIENRLQGATLQAIFFSSLTNPTTRFVNNMVYAAVALFGALAIINGAGGQSEAFTIGMFSVMLSYTNQYTKPFNEISGIFAEFQNALASAKRVFDFIEAEAEVPDSPDAKSLDGVSGSVDISDVNFSYTEDKPLIQNLNLSVKPSQRVAIVGPTGCGKTTIINLLMRFYDVNSGSISIDGNDIRDITRKSLRASYGMVLQDTFIASGTVRENIAFGRPDATEEEIISAAKASHAHSFIKRLKNGYDTKIGDGGEELSVGQKQLICIARVMLTLPPMLILDEATSSIDTRTELKIQEAFTKMMHGRTCFIVAHRLSTIREADVILVMKDGNIIESGTHKQLLENKGFYSKLYFSQFDN